MGEAWTLANARGAIDTTRAMGSISTTMTGLTTPQGRQAFLNNPQSVSAFLAQASTIASNANNPLVTGPVQTGFLQSVSSATQTFTGSPQTAATARQCASQIMAAIDTAGGPQAIAASGRAMAQCLANPMFTQQINNLQGNGAQLVQEIGTLNQQLGAMFPPVAQAQQAATQLLQQGLQSLPSVNNIIGGIMQGGGKGK